ncbi:MAG: porin family protein [Siphonobacter sp.]
MRIITVLVLMLVAGTVSAQRENLSFGPMVGGNYSTIVGIKNIPSITPEYKLGPTAGLFLNYSIREHFGLSLNALYSEVGAKDYLGTNDLKLNYINVPVLATYYFGNDMGTGAIRPKLFLGPNVNFLVGNNDLVSGVKIDFNKVDVGLTAGIGVNIGLSNQQWLNIDLRYNRGFMGLYHNPDQLIKPYVQDARNQYFSLTVGYSFPLGHYNKTNNRFKRR